ncbi:MAG: MFS transporter, partial [Candidatus Hodarchaeales archaeon]
MNRNFWLVFICHFLFSLNRSLSRGNFPEYVIILGGTLVSWGLIASIGTISNIIAIVPSNFLGDFFGRRRILVVIGILGFVGSCFTYFAPSWEWLTIGYVALELQQGIFVPTSIALMTDVISGPQKDSRVDERVKFFTYFELAGVAGGSIGFLISSIYFFFVGDIYTEALLRGNMFLAVIIAIVLMIISFGYEPIKSSKPKNLDDDENSQSKKLIKPTKREMGVVFGFTLSSFFIGLGAGFFIPFAQPYWKNVFNLSPSAINLILGVSFFFISLGMLSLPYLMNRLTQTQIIILSQLTAVPLIFIIAWSPLLAFVLPAYLSRFMLMNMGRPVQNNLLQRGLEDQYRATGQSITRLADRIGRGITPTIASIIILDWGYSISFSITA